MKYTDFVLRCTLPLAFVIEYYSTKNNIPWQGQLFIFIALMPITFILLLPGFLVGVIFGIPYSIYNNLISHCDRKNGATQADN